MVWCKKGFIVLGVMNVLQLTGWWLNNPPFDKSMNVMGAVIALWFGLDLIDDSYFLHNIYLEAVDSARAPRSIPATRKRGGRV